MLTIAEFKMSSHSSQLALPLDVVVRWGGRRRDAGRKRGDKVQHLTRARFKRLPAHVTLRVRSDVPSLRTVPIVHAIERTFAAGCTRPGFRLVHYSLQTNHAHLIVEADDRHALGRGMKAIAARLALAVNRVAGRKGPVLADRYHHESLPTPRQVRNALRYVLLNARRHAAKAGAPLGGDARPDPASSARWFDGWKRAPSYERAVARRVIRRPVARPRLWLLTVGWRRHGLIDAADVPG